jgi:hypothetical protein
MPAIQEPDQAAYGPWSGFLPFGPLRQRGSILTGHANGQEARMRQWWVTPKRT